MPLIDVDLAAEFAMSDSVSLRFVTDEEKQRWASDDYASELIPRRRAEVITAVLDIRGDVMRLAGEELYHALAVISFAVDNPVEVSLIERYRRTTIDGHEAEARSLAHFDFVPRIKSHESPFGKHRIGSELDISMLRTFFRNAYREQPHARQLRYGLARWYLSKMRAFSDDACLDLCTALEAIFVSREESRTGPITHRLATRVANYYGESDDQRLEYYDRCDRLYDIRAGITHGEIGMPDAAKAAIDDAYFFVEGVIGPFLGGDDAAALLANLEDYQWVPLDRLPKRLRQQRLAREKRAQED